MRGSVKPKRLKRDIEYEEDEEDEEDDASGFEESSDDDGSEQPEEEDMDIEQQVPDDVVHTSNETVDYLSDVYCKHRVHQRLDHCRPENTVEGDIVFQHTETTYFVNRSTGVPTVRIFGVTKEGNSVMVEDETFRPYFFVAASCMDHAQELRQSMEKFYARHYERKRNGNVTNGMYIRDVEQHSGRTIMGYHKNGPEIPLFKFILAQPCHVSVGREWLEGGNRYITPTSIRTFEGNVPFELRYMIDRNIHGCEWISIKADSYHCKEAVKCVSTSQNEIVITKPSGIQAFRPEERGDIAPMRVLGYDIEVYRREPGFPTADVNPVIMICAALYVPGRGVVNRACFAVRGGSAYGPIEGANVYVYDTEKEMLMAFRQYVLECDPECFTGWNTNNFDMPFLIKRAEVLGIAHLWTLLSRIKSSPLWVRKSTFQSRANGARANNEVNCEGRYDFDGMTFFLRGVMKKYRSYALNAIAMEVLGEQKADVDYSQIPDLFDSAYSDDTTRLLFYCMRDTELVLTLLDKQMAMVNGIEQARVTGVPIKWLMSRGQGVKTFSNLLRFKNISEHVPSKTNKANLQTTGGGHVEDPLRGFYKWAVNTMDFASLYPSIMIAYNICYSTKVSLAWARANLKPEDYWVPFPSVDAPDLHSKKRKADEPKKKSTPLASFFGVAPVSTTIGERKRTKKERDRDEQEASIAGKEPDFCFVKKHIREGILPAMLDKLLKARSNVKRMMKSAKGFEYGVLDGRQLALKVVCNSVYGFLKAHTVVDPDLMAAVTSYGRNMLRIVKETVAENFNAVEIVDWHACVAAGLDPEDDTLTNRPMRKAWGQIVYGDTDSVMVFFGPITLTDAVRIGRELSKQCTARFVPPNELAFETIKLRSAFMNKKRYMALQIESFKDGERFEAAIVRSKMTLKGLEGARRDNARIGSRTQTRCAETLLRTADIEKAEEVVKKVLSDLYCNHVDLSDLIISKCLSKTDEQYRKGGSKQQHVVLQQKIKARAHLTGETVPATGDRVPYVMVCGAKKSSAGDRSESPLFAQKNGLPIDVEYYVNKQVWPAVIRILTAYHEPNRCTEISSSMNMKKRATLMAHKRLFDPALEHMRHRKRPRMRAATFARVRNSCGGCDIPLANQTDTVCVRCNVDAVQQRLENDSAASKALHQQAWDTCRKCQGGNFEKVSCANISCTNFFHRNTVTMDMEDTAQELANFLTRRRGVDGC